MLSSQLGDQNIWFRWNLDGKKASFHLLVIDFCWLNQPDLIIIIALLLSQLQNFVSIVKFSHFFISMQIWNFVCNCVIWFTTHSYHLLHPKNHTIFGPVIFVRWWSTSYQTMIVDLFSSSVAMCTACSCQNEQSVIFANE